MVTNETERARRHYDNLADRYDRLISAAEATLFGGGRQWVCTQASGAVLEIAVGTGRNFAYYPTDIRLTGIDISPAMLAVADQRAQELGRDVELRVGDAQALALPDARFDTVVATLALCSIPDARRAVAEARRVLRPGGRFLLLEHVRSPILPVRTAQRVLDPLFVRCCADHLLREPLDYLTTEGFIVERVERSKWGIVERIVARKPA